jgi:hypothetical protein
VKVDQRWTDLRFGASRDYIQLQINIAGPLISDVAIYVVLIGSNRRSSGDGIELLRME